MKTEKEPRNLFLEILRFIFALMIFFHHSGFLVNGDATYPFKTAGFFAVEFFFFVSGAFCMKRVRELRRAESTGIKSPMQKALSYTIGKLKRVFPYAALGIVLCYVWSFLQADPSLSFKDRLFGRWNIVYELFFIPMTGVMDVGLESFLNTPLWYLSVLLIALPVVMFLALRFSDVFDHYLCIFVPLVLHGYLIFKFGSVGNWGENCGLVYSGVIRGFADLLFGCLIYNVSVLIYEKSRVPRFVITCFEIVLYLFAIYSFNTNVDGYTYEFAIIAMGLGLVISLSGKSATARIKGAFFGHLGKLSLPIFALHWPVYRFITLYADGIGYWAGVGLAFVVCIAISELMMFAVNKVKQLRVSANG